MCKSDLGIQLMRAGYLLRSGCVILWRRKTRTILTALSMTVGCALRAPHGGSFVFPVGDHAVMYCVALAIGSVVGAVILSLLKKNRTEE